MIKGMRKAWFLVVFSCFVPRHYLRLLYSHCLETKGVFLNGYVSCYSVLECAMNGFDEAVRFFRKFDKTDSLERVADRLQREAKTDEELRFIISAADHRRAEIANKRYFDPGCVPRWAWAAVV